MPANKSLTPLDRAFMEATLKEFVFADDVGGSFPISLDTYDHELDGNIVRFTVSADLSKVPDYHQTSAAQVAREETILELTAAIARELKAAGLPAYRLHARRVEVEY